MTYVHHTNADVNQTFTCVLTDQYIEVFVRNVPFSFTVTLCVLNVILAIIATLLNLLIIVAIIKTPSLHKPSFILLFNLAVTDLAVGITFGPIEVAYLISRELGHYGLFCTIWKFITMLGYFLCSASMYTVTCISFDRYLSISMPIKYKTVVTKKKVYITVVLMWVWSVLGTSSIGVLGNEVFLLLVCCVTVFNMIVIIDCYLLSFAAIKQQDKENKFSTIIKKSKSESDLSAVQTIEMRLSAVTKRLSDQENRFSGDFVGAKMKEDLRKREQDPSNRKRQLRGEEHQNIISHSKMKNVMVKKDIECASDEEEVKVKCERKVEREINVNDEITPRNQVKQHDTNKTQLQTKGWDKDTLKNLAIQKADVKSFKQTLHTILIVVVALFVCYLPYLFISILISLHVINSGVIKNSAAIIIYTNSSINSFIMCTRITGIRKACGRILWKIFKK